MYDVAIVGAGQLGALLGNDLMDNYRSIYKPIFYIDVDNSLLPVAFSSKCSKVGWEQQIKNMMLICPDTP